MAIRLSPRFLLLLFITSSLPSLPIAFSHWMVTEDGMVQHQSATPFNLRQPFNLIAFMQQEERVATLRSLRKELLQYKKQFEQVVDVESFQQLYQADQPDCWLTKGLSKYNLHLSTVLNLEDIEGLMSLQSPDDIPHGVPYCSKLHPSLPFSMSSLDHLPGVQQRESLISSPEPSLIAHLHIRPQQLGGAVQQSLKKNTTSWVLLNLASLYWRVKGNAQQSVECSRRALHYSPSSHQDVALLNLANVLHQSHHSKDALIVLRIALSVSPTSSTIHLTTGNVLAHLGMLNESILAYQRAVMLDSQSTQAKSLLHAASCELQLKTATRHHNIKMAATRKKLDLFYEYMAELYQNQVSSSTDVLDYWNSNLLNTPDKSSPQSSTSSSQQEDSSTNIAVEGGDKDGHIPTHKMAGFDVNKLQTVLSNVAEDISKVRDHPVEATRLADRSRQELELETALDNALSKIAAERDNFREKTSSKQERRTEETDLLKAGKETKEVKQPVKKPKQPKQPFSYFASDIRRADTCPRLPYWYPNNVCYDGGKMSSAPVITLTGIHLDKIVDPSKQSVDPSLQKKMTLLHSHKRAQTEGRKARSDESAREKSSENSKHNDAYRQMEFLPFTALPQSLEELIFPDRSTPPADFDDPFWPTKLDCLKLVEASGNLPKFTGTFLTPEARGVSFDQLFSSVPSPLPHTLRQLPVCSDIVELPYSMSAMDHLEGVAMRQTLRTSEQAAEKGLQQLLVATLKGATHMQHTAEEAAMKVFSALMKHGPHWALFNLASLYWRSVGNGQYAIECLRRAIHFASNDNKDVGFIGLANTLQRHGYMDNAVVTSKAALDIRPDSPIGHYTLASCYLSSGDMLATSLHLRMALHLQPNFGHALSALKLVMCSLKFKEEQKQLEHKQRMLLAQQKMMKEGKDFDFSEEAVKTSSSSEDKLKESGMEVIHYLATLAIAQRGRLKEDRVGQAMTNTVSYSKDEDKGKILPSSSFQLSASVDRLQETHSFAKNKSDGSKNKTQDLADLTRKLAKSVSAAIADISTAKEAQPSTKQQSPATSTKKPKYTMEFMAKESAREEELRKQWPAYLPWPTLDECHKKPPSRYIVFTSTWLSVTAKKINITDFIDFEVVPDDYSLLPICELDDSSAKILDHLEGMNGPPLVDYIAERGLEEVLCKLEGSLRGLDELATRIKLTMKKNEFSWVLYNLAALYWRIVGDGQQAIKCLKLALNVSSPTNKDVALVSLANVLYRSGYYKDAAIAMQMALETSPNLVVNHFTMANILAAQGYYREAAGYYEVVLYHQPEFGPAADRLRTVRCMIVLGDNKQPKISST